MERWKFDGYQWIIDDDDKFVANIGEKGFTETENARRTANARLIASAPELLEALKEIAELTTRRQLPLTSQINDCARAAIAKAEGGK